jgi:hypothetical protein
MRSGAKEAGRLSKSNVKPATALGALKNVSRHRTSLMTHGHERDH